MARMRPTISRVTRGRSLGRSQLMCQNPPPPPYIIMGLPGEDVGLSPPRSKLEDVPHLPVGGQPLDVVALRHRVGIPTSLFQRLRRHEAAVLLHDAHRRAVAVVPLLVGQGLSSHLPLV